MVSVEAAIGGSSGRSVRSQHVVCVGGLWTHLKPLNKLLVFPLARFSVHRISQLDNESDDFLRISQSLLSTEANEVKSNLLEKVPRRTIALAQVRKLDTQGNYSQFVQYLLDLGMGMVEIERLVHKSPSILEDNIKSGVDYLSDLGLDPLNIPKILRKHPRFTSSASVKCSIKLINYLKKLGLDNNQLVKAYHRHPLVFNVTPTNVEVTVNYLRELDLSEESIIRIIARCPLILGLSLEENIIPKAAYFESIGLEVVTLIKRTPEVFGFSIDKKLNRVVEFFLERDYTMEEVQVILTRYTSIFTLSLEKNLEPKWNYFVYMGYPRDEIVKFPAYFGYSLEKRIKPRFETMVDLGIRLPLSSWLSRANREFSVLLERKRG